MLFHIYNRGGFFFYLFIVIGNEVFRSLIGVTIWDYDYCSVELSSFYFNSTIMKITI